MSAAIVRGRNAAGIVARFSSLARHYSMNRATLPSEVVSIIETAPQKVAPA